MSSHSFLGCCDHANDVDDRIKMVNTPHRSITEKEVVSYHTPHRSKAGKEVVYYGPMDPKP